MPKSKNYKLASGAHSAATRYGVGADNMASKRRADQEIANINRGQMHTAFGAASEAVGIGKNLWDVYTHNKKQMEYAKDLGLNVKSGWLGQMFGDPEYEDPESGETLSGDFIGAVKQWGEFYEGENIMDALVKRKTLMRQKKAMKEASTYDPNKVKYDLIGTDERMG